MNDDFWNEENGKQPANEEENRAEELTQNAAETTQEQETPAEVTEPFAGNTANESPFDYGRQPVYEPIFRDSSEQQSGSAPYTQPPYNGYQPHQPINNPYGYPAGDPNNPPKKKNTGMKVFFVLIAVIVVLAFALMAAVFTGTKGLLNQNNNHNTPNAESESSIGNEKLDTDNVNSLSPSSSSLNAGEASEVAKIVKKFNVGILIYANDSLATEGSGVIVKEDNDKKYTYIVTCAHVVNHQNTGVSVLMEDGTEYPAEVVGFDTRTDLAVVRIEKAGLTAAEFASSDELIVGQYVYAVGNPGGSEFFGSVTNGIISAIGRPVSSSSTGYQMECIQHTSAINPGNSGGALVNGEGKVIGINSMKIASTEYEGMGFAVPSSVVMEVFNSIIENGYVAGRAKLGITYTTPSGYSQTYAMYVQMRGLPSGTIVIDSVAADSDLADKDIEKGDLITQVNGKDMTDSGMLSSLIEDMSVGDTLTLTIVRVNTDNWSQTQKKVTVKLVEDKGNTAAQPAESPTNNNQGNPFGGFSGNNPQDWYDFFKQYYGY